MRTHLSIVSAAALAVAGLALMPHAVGQAVGHQDQGGQSSAGQAGQGGSAGVQPGLGQGGAGVGPGGQRPGGVDTELGAGAQDAHLSDVRFIIARVADAALSEGGSTQLLAYLSEADRQRLSGEFDQQDPQLRQSVQQLHEAWRQKYNREFEIGTQPLAFNATNLRIIEGDLADGARVAGERVGGGGAGAGEPGASGETGARDTDGATGAAGGAGTSGGTGEASPAGDVGATGGARGTGAAAGAGDQPHPGLGASARGDIASAGERISVVIPQDRNAPTVILHLTRDQQVDGSWKIVLPPTVDAKRVQTNLQRHIGALAGQAQQWPASEEQAYVLVAHHVLAALTDASAMAEREDAAREQTDRPVQPGEPNSVPGQDRATPGTPPQPPQPDQPGDGSATPGRSW